MLDRLLAWLPSRARRPDERRGEIAYVHNPGVRIVDGLIRPNYACQSELVRHCNMACLDCNHLSPLMKRDVVEPAALYRDYSLLAKVYRPELVYLTGGEPLLHPDVVGAIQAVKESGITERVRVLTNGILLSRMSEAFWLAVDDVEVSIYPSSRLQPEDIGEWKALAERHSVHLEVFRFTEFRRSFIRTPIEDQALVRRLFNACKAAHVWGCHYVDDGHMYRCPQSAYLPRMLDLPGSSHRRDGLALRDGPDFQDELYRFLTSSEPLEGCRNCLATAGVQRPHVEVRRRDWIEMQDGAAGELVDFRELARIESEMDNMRRDHIKDYV